MTQRVIDVLESVQIYILHRDPRTITIGCHNRLCNSISQQGSVRQIRENIVLGQMGHLHSHRPWREYVVENDYGSGHQPISIMDGGSRNFDGRFRPVASNEHTVLVEFYRFIFLDRGFQKARTGLSCDAVDDFKYLIERLAEGLLSNPTRYLFRYNIEVGNFPSDVGVEYSVPDRVERDLGARFCREQHLFGSHPLCHIAYSTDE